MAKTKEPTSAERDAALAALPAVAVNVGDPEEEIEKIETDAPAVSPNPAMPEIETSFDLRRPVEHKGVTYTHIELSRDRLTGEALTRAERIYMVECPGASAQNMLGSITFMQILGSIAAGVPYAAVKKMAGADAFRLAASATALFSGNRPHRPQRRAHPVPAAGGAVFQQRFGILPPAS